MPRENTRRVTLNTRNGSVSIDPNLGGTVCSLSFPSSDSQGDPASGVNSTEEVSEPEQLLHPVQIKSGSAPDWPGGGIPILFPFAGRTWRDGSVGEYEFQDRVYPMPIHGFQYLQTSPLHINSNKESIQLIYSSNKETLEFFPWNYELTLMYFFQNNHTFVLDMKISNFGGNSLQDEPPLPFAIGYHPYFRLPHPINNRQNSTTLDIVSESYYPVTNIGAAGPKADLNDLAPKKTSLPFYQNLILKSSPKDQSATLDKATKSGSESEEIKVLMTSPDFKLDTKWVLWGKETEAFFCLEPWMGLPDAINNREGLREIPLGESITIRLEISKSQI